MVHILYVNIECKLKKVILSLCLWKRSLHVHLLPNADNNEAGMVELMHYSPNNEKIQVFYYENV